METTRFILTLALLLVLLMLWQAWEADYGTNLQEPSAQKTPAEGKQELIQKDTDIPEAPQSDTPPSEDTLPVISGGESRKISVNTDVYHIEISLRGAGIQHAELRNYPVSINHPEDPFILMDNSRSMIHITQGGLLSTDPSPTHEYIYRSEKSVYDLLADQDTLKVPLSWENAGVKVTKVFEFTRGSYLIKIYYQIENNNSRPWIGRTYSQLKRNNPGRSAMSLGIYTYTGAILSSPDERYKKISFDDMEEQNLKQEIIDGWAAMIQHYFVTALLPVSKTTSYRYYTKALSDGNYAIGVITPGKQIGPNSIGVIEEQIYIGPKVQKDLSKIAEGLELTVDYGIFWFIAKPLFWFLSKLHDYTANWGWSIILVTILLKLLFYPLSAAGYRSMANMRKVQPRIMTIRDRYKDDKARLNQAMMQIYKEEKVNPFGGCFPILIQIPVFISLYWVLLESVEMRQASFVLWLQDLSGPDPYFILPVLMGITMFIQQKLNPAPLDPVQAKVMTVLPIVFTIFFAFFPSGLVLYWVVNNILSIAQQWQITRNIERAGSKLKAP